MHDVSLRYLLLWILPIALYAKILDSIVYHSRIYNVF